MLYLPASVALRSGCQQRLQLDVGLRERRRIDGLARGDQHFRQPDVAGDAIAWTDSARRKQSPVGTDLEDDEGAPANLSPNRGDGPFCKAGHLKRQGRISRGIEAPGGGIPLLGRVAAGQPTLAEESFDGSLEPSEVFGNREGLFALRVKGDSMIEAGILEGDYVIVRAQQNATAGQMVVGMIDGEATVKFYQPKKDRIELVPANSRYEPIVVQRAADFSILGIVKGVIRTVR